MIERYRSASDAETGQAAVVITLLTAAQQTIEATAGVLTVLTDALRGLLG